MGPVRRGQWALPDPVATVYKQRVIRVFLLDDHEVVRRGIADLLTQDGDIEIVGESGSAVEAVHRIPALHPNVAVLDARLPDGNGIDVCRDVRAVSPAPVRRNAQQT